mgnify:CR=1 FL=1
MLGNIYPLDVSCRPETGPAISTVYRAVESRSAAADEPGQAARYRGRGSSPLVAPLSLPLSTQLAIDGAAVAIRHAVAQKLSNRPLTSRNRHNSPQAQTPPPRTDSGCGHHRRRPSQPHDELLAHAIRCRASAPGTTRPPRRRLPGPLGQLLHEHPEPCTGPPRHAVRRRGSGRVHLRRRNGDPLRRYAELIAVPIHTGVDAARLYPVPLMVNYVPANVTS